MITVAVMLSQGMVVGFCHCSSATFLAADCPFCENCCSDSECDCEGKCKGRPEGDDCCSYLALVLDEFVEGDTVSAPRLLEFARFVPYPLSYYFYPANLSLQSEEASQSRRFFDYPDATPPISGVAILRRYSVALV